MDAYSPGESTRALVVRLRDDEAGVRLALRDIVETLGVLRANALADQAIALEAAGGMVRVREGIRVRLSTSGVFLVLAQEAGWKPRANMPTSRFANTALPPRAVVASSIRTQAPPAQLHVTIRTSVAPKEIATTLVGKRVYALEASGRVVTFTLEPSAYKRFEALDDPSSPGVAIVITGKLGRPTPEGFELAGPAVREATRVNRRETPR